MDHIQNRPMEERSIVARENVNSFPMLKTLIASGVAVSAAALASPALADVYVNIETTAGYRRRVSGRTR